MWISILGMYNHDDSVFDDFNVPAGIDKQTVIDNILLKCAELEIVYTQFETLKTAIKAWSLSEQYTWNTLYKTTVLDYNPIWNVDADIEETGTGNKNSTRNIARHNQGSGSNNRTLNLSDNETIDITDIESVKGFNSNSWAEAKKNEKDGTDNIKHTGTDNTALSSTEDETVGETLGETSGDTRTIRRTGNIGVTTTQQMIEQEREIAKFNVIDFITESFKERFCLMIY